jgi:hypothetical protein
MLLESCDAQRRGEGCVLVRVHSSDGRGRPLPDAVFTFRAGDPQYAFWSDRADADAGQRDG